jgi:predicted transcriptional regulator
MSDLTLMALDLMRNSGGCATAAAVAQRLGISKTHAAHVLRSLARSGLACAAVTGSNFKIYCLRGVEVEDAFAAVPCFQHLREAFEKAAEGHRGRVALVSAADLAAALAERCGVSMDMLIFPVRAYLDMAIAPRAISVSRGGKYVLPTEALRRFSLSPPKVPAKCPKAVEAGARPRPRERMAITTVKLPMETLEALDHIAEARGTIRSIIIREALAEYVERHAEEMHAQAPHEGDEDMPAIQGRI